MFSIATLNINGLCNKNIQLKLLDFVKLYKIDVVLMQEHNLRKPNMICDELLNEYDFVINYSIALKGGTLIMLSKRKPFYVLSSEKSADSRIMLVKLKLYDQIFNLVNIYAHAGDSKERELLFSNDLPYYLRNSLSNTIIGGDFNCVLSGRDTESTHANISKSLNNLVKTLQLKDLWFAKNRLVQYTYLRTNFGSRIDRLYGADSYNSVSSIRTINLDFTDHSCVICKIDIDTIPKCGKYYWKLNTTLLELEGITEMFQIEWDKIRSSKNNYDTINQWWDKFAKKEIKQFFVKISKKENQRKSGLLNYLEFC